MKKRIRSWRPHLLMIAAFFLSSCSGITAVDILNSVIPEAGYVLHSDVVYGTNPRQSMDIYLPTKVAKQPRTIIFVYGGAWRDGRKDDYKFLGHALANAGHTVVIPDYRLYPKVQYPDFIVDIANAIGQLASSDGLPHAPLMDEIILMGHSSGAHTAALLVTDKQYLNNVNAKVIALIALSGPYDLPIDNPEVAPVFATASNARLTNPVQQVSSNHPPTLLLHGIEDERVFPFHAENYAAALRQAQVPVFLELLEDEDHQSIIAGIAAPLDATNQTSELIANFLMNLDNTAK